jgi:hypothetical protein
MQRKHAAIARTRPKRARAHTLLNSSRIEAAHIALLDQSP